MFFVFFSSGFPSTLLSGPNVCLRRLNNCWGRFYSRLWTLQAVTGECGGGWPQTSVCQRGVTHVSHRFTLSSKPVASYKWYELEQTADILHSWAHSTKYNNFLEFFNPRRRSQGTSCCPRSTSCSCSSISPSRCHGHWKTLYSCLIGTSLQVMLRWSGSEEERDQARFWQLFFNWLCQNLHLQFKYGA